MRARVGFNPNTPEADAGIRIEPPPSLACATGRMRAATAAAAPPDEPPEECARFQGLRVGPMQARLRGRHQAEFRAGALAEDRDAGLEEALGEGAGVVGDVILVDAGAEGRPRALEEIEILQQKRHAREGTIRKSLVDLPLRIVVMLYDHRIDLRIDLGGTGDRLVEQLRGRDLLVANEFGKPEPVIAAVFLEGHIGTCC